MSKESLKNGSDISSESSSWTLINKSSTEHRRKSTENLESHKATKELVEIKSEKSKQSPIIKAIKPQKERNKRKNSKRGLDCSNILSIIACLFTITGITLFTTLLPINHTESAEMETLRSHLDQVYKNSQNPDYEKVSKSLEATREALSMSSFQTFSENFENASTCEAPYFMEEFYDLNEPDIPMMSLDTDDEEFIPDKLPEEELNNKPSNKTLLSAAKQLVKNPAFQMFVATLIQDICFVKLINELSKKNNDEEKDAVKHTINKGLKKKTKKTVLGSKCKKINKNPSIPLSSELVKKAEPGDKKFEEINCKWSTLGQNHRQKIQQIKNKFQEQIIELKEREKESFSRREKIRFLREKFIQRLKTDRESYLHKLRKLREEKQTILHDICHNFKKYRNFSAKDVSVGNFAVLVPNQYNFNEKIKEMKQKQDTPSNLTIESAKIFSYPPNKADDTTSSKIFEEDLSESKQSAEDDDCCNNEEFQEVTRRKLGKKAKRKQLKDSKQVQEVMDSIVNSLSDTTSKNLLENNTEESTTDEEFLDFNNIKGKKRSLTNLYDAAFDLQSKKIKKRDSLKWGKKVEDFKWSNGSDFTKQDPSKMYNQIIMHKGVL